MSLLSGLGGALTGFVTGGPVGAITGAIKGWQGSDQGPGMVPGGGSIGGFPLPTNLGTGPGGLLQGGIFDPNGLGRLFGSGGGAMKPGPNGCPSGYHLNKHALAAGKRHGAVAARTICVRNRHMHALNERALNRALRRTKKATKLVRKLHVIHPVRRAVGRKR